MTQKQINSFMKKHNLPNPDCAKMFMKILEQMKSKAQKKIDSPEKERESGGEKGDISK